MKKMMSLGLLALGVCSWDASANIIQNPNDTMIETKQHRCRKFNDYLDQPQARGRMQWVNRCKDQIKSKRVKSSLDLIWGNAICNANRPCYVLFGSYDQDGRETNIDFKTGKPFIAPVNGGAGCKEGVDIINRNNFRVIAVCMGGCYSPKEMLFYSNGDFATVKDAHSRKLGLKDSAEKMQIVSVEQNPSTGEFTFVDRDVEKYYETDTDVKEGELKEKLVKVELETGDILNITPDHPLVDEQGKFQRVRDLKVGDKVLTVDSFNYPGTPLTSKSEIVSMEEYTFKGKVYNVDIKKSSSDIVIAGNVLNGTMKVQNEPTKKLNRALFTINLDDELVK